MFTIPLRSGAAALLLGATSVLPTLAQNENPLVVTVSGQTRMALDSSGTLLLRGQFKNGPFQNPGSGALLMWYPHRAAFRVGSVDAAQWDDINVGNYSIAMGNSTTASGISSTAMGGSTTASGAFSTSTGRFTTAIGHSSTATDG